MTKTKLRALDMSLLDHVFEMGGGYVLDFSNATFAAFFSDEVGIDIDRPEYAAEGGSKAKRLRFFLRNSPPELSAKAIEALWEYRETRRRRSGSEETVPDAKSEMEALLSRLKGRTHQAQAVNQFTEHRPDPSVLAHLSRELVGLSQLSPQPRGYAFERFLKTVFDAYGLGARASFRLVGEQIDGSFELGNETYLLEAKWTAEQIDASALRSFNAKVEDKATWSRGLFVSNNGFSEQGLVAFGRRKSIVCMDGLDLYDMIKTGLAFPDVISRKVRRAAETGNPFVRVRDLFPNAA